MIHFQVLTTSKPEAIGLISAALIGLTHKTGSGFASNAYKDECPTFDSDDARNNYIQISWDKNTEHLNMGYTAGLNPFKPSQYKIITFEQAIVGIMKKDFSDVLPPDAVIIKLNNEYDATVSKDGIKVGCQTFPLSIVEDLATAVRTVTK